VTLPAAPLAARFERPWAVLLSTRRRDGTWVPTRVNIAVDGEHAYVGTAADTGKVRRLRADPEVRVQPCSLRGRPTGPQVHARARLLQGAEAAAAARHLRRAYPVTHGLVVPVELRLRGTRGLYYRLEDFRTAD
jgi:hypothetical protein